MNQTATTLLTALQPAPRLPRAPFAVKTSGFQILLLDDSTTVLNVMSAILRRIPNLLLTVESSARRALEILRRDPGNFDLVLTDIRMPIMDGVEFARHVKNLRPELPVLAVTTSPRAIDGNPDFSGVVPKPFSPEDLIAEVSSFLRDLAPASTTGALSSLNSDRTHLTQLPK